MACLFGHKWNGCKCEKCGKIHDDIFRHVYKDSNKTNVKRCETCGVEVVSIESFLLSNFFSDSIMAVLNIKNNKANMEIIKERIPKFTSVFPNNKEILENIQNINKKLKNSIYLFTKGEIEFLCFIWTMDDPALTLKLAVDGLDWYKQLEPYKELFYNS